MNRQVRQNPAWSSDIMHRFCDSIRRAADAHDLPAPIFSEKCKVENRSELGQGVYGVVWTTEAADCAFKLSTDSSESHFIQTAINMRNSGQADPAGIVDYRAIFALPADYEGRKVFAIWREQAYKVGLPRCLDKEPKAMVSFANFLNDFYETSADAFETAYNEREKSHEGLDRYFDWVKERVDLANDMIDGKKISHQSTFSNMLYQCYLLSMDIEESGKYGKHVGEALRTYFENGILLCDIHQDNVGHVERGGCDEMIVITDPGHSLVLSKDLIDIEIPLLKE